MKFLNLHRMTCITDTLVEFDSSFPFVMYGTFAQMTSILDCKKGSLHFGLLDVFQSEMLPAWQILQHPQTNIRYPHLNCLKYAIFKLHNTFLSSKIINVKPFNLHKKIFIQIKIIYFINVLCIMFTVIHYGFRFWYASSSSSCFLLFCLFSKSNIHTIDILYQQKGKFHQLLQ